MPGQPPNPPFTAAGLLMPVETVSLQASAASAQLMTGIGLLVCGTAANINTTAVSRFRLHDGTDATGNVLATVSLPAGASLAFGPGWPGILFQRGLWVEFKTGTYDVVITYIPLLTQP